MRLPCKFQCTSHVFAFYFSLRSKRIFKPYSALAFKPKSEIIPNLNKFPEPNNKSFLLLSPQVRDFTSIQTYISADEWKLYRLIVAIGHLKSARICHTVRENDWKNPTSFKAKYRTDISEKNYKALFLL